MRASRIIATRTDRISTLITDVCEERQEGLVQAPPTPQYSSGARRRSAPSPRLIPQPHSQQPILTDFRTWAASKYAAYPIRTHQMSTSPLDECYESQSALNSIPSFTAAAQASYYQQPFYSHRYHANRNQQHHYYSQRSQNMTVSPSASSSTSAPSTTPTLERRSSWDGSKAPDLHRFFQSPPDLSELSTSTAPTSPVMTGLPSASSSGPRSSSHASAERRGDRDGRGRSQVQGQANGVNHHPPSPNPADMFNFSSLGPIQFGNFGGGGQQQGPPSRSSSPGGSPVSIGLALYSTNTPYQNGPPVAGSADPTTQPDDRSSSSSRISTSLPTTIAFGDVEVTRGRQAHEEVQQAILRNGASRMGRKPKSPSREPQTISISDALASRFAFPGSPELAPSFAVDAPIPPISTSTSPRLNGIGMSWTDSVTPEESLIESTDALRIGTTSPSMSAKR